MADSIDMAMARPNVVALRRALCAFTSSASSLGLVRTYGHGQAAITSQRLATTAATIATTSSNILVLDSSFNPPTNAHLRMCLSALADSPSSTPSTLVLLLATNNADKPVKPVEFEQRLAMMELFAQEVLSQHRHQQHAIQVDSPPLTIDVALTSTPYFADKAAALHACGRYPRESTIATTARTTPDKGYVFLVGFDTLLRILDARYYDAQLGLRVLDDFFQHHRLRVAYREQDRWGARAEQEAHLRDIASGGRAEDGVDAAWVSERRIVLVEGHQEGDVGAVSSSRIRDLIDQGCKDDSWEELLPASIAGWIKEHHLYGSVRSM